MVENWYFNFSIRNSWIFLASLAITFLPLIGSAQTTHATTWTEKPKISFNRDIKPLLSDRCFQCHGPDESSRQGGFRLDVPESVLGEADSGETPIVPGDPSNSELIRRIALDSDDGDLMPPEDSHKPRMTPKEIQLLKAWIEAGAIYEQHWSFVPPSRPEVPANPVTWGNGPINQFILRKMLEHGLQPSKAADRSKLIRRLSLDLTGLPPKPDEVEAFVQDASPNAYETVVDRLLRSPRYGEHMARYWLDAVRYGDTHGLHLDNYREIWPYRDWVMNAFNANMDWANFTTKQIAGDLIADPTTKDLIASGYNRLHITTNEGGSIQEEVYVRNVVDRVATTGSVFLGLSVGCAQCHDHKFDPLTSRDFYSMFAFFNNLEANPMDGNVKDHAPILRIPTEESNAKLADLAKKIEPLTARFEQNDPELDQAFQRWHDEWHERMKSLWSSLQVVEATSAAGSTLEIDSDQNVVTATGDNPSKDTYELTLQTDLTEITGLQLEVMLGDNGFGGRAHNGNAVLSEIQAEIRSADEGLEIEKLRFISAVADYSQPTFPAANAIDGTIEASSGWAIEGHQKKENRAVTFATDRPFGFEGGTIIRVRLIFESQFSQHSFQRVRLSASTDPIIAPQITRPWSLLGPFVSDNGQTAYHHDYGPETNVDLTKVYPQSPDSDAKIGWIPQPNFADAQTHLFSDQSIGVHYLHREILSPGERDLTISLGSDDAIRVWLNNELIHENNVARGVAPDQETVKLPLRSGSNNLLLKIINFGGAAGFYYSEKETGLLITNVKLQSILKLPPQERTPDQQSELQVFFRESSPEWKKLNAEIEALKAEQQKVESQLPTTLIMKERVDPKPAFLLTRGQYDRPDKELGPLPRAVPSFLPPLAESAPRNRTGFAQWLLSPNHPLLARVTVNRFWQQFMGTGIVATADDFGSQGSPPTHPELLDWLAVEFRESGWDVKSVVKQIVMSETYRQDSTISAKAYQTDPKNQWLARGPRYRLDAETLRDQALAVSGLLVYKMGGPSVKPPQPAGLWKSVGYVGSNTSVFTADSEHEKVHRRSIYTFWKRTSPPPQMSVFDAPTREECVVSRERTNNPLQALLLLNDPQYFEAARHLAERIIREESSASPHDHARRMFYLATLRKPTPDELHVLLNVFEKQLKVFRTNVEAAKQVLAVSALPVPDSVEPHELAAWTLVANVVLNLDELINKQ